MAFTLGEKIMERCEILANFSEDEGALTRTYLTPEHRRVNKVVATWMEDAGMRVRTDAVGNIIGRLEGEVADLPAVLLGSHLDTLRDAGKYDGALGVVTAISCVAELKRRRRSLPFAVEVIGFAEEEGLRFQSTIIGSRAVAGSLERNILDRRDKDGVTLDEAMRRFGLDGARILEAARRPEELLAYLELHIEQGPVLETHGLPVGVVSSIAGNTRLAVLIQGMAGHAGTVPMPMRKDTLAAAAECILSVETICQGKGLMGTVGFVETRPGAVNVIAGQAMFTVDVRSDSDIRRQTAIEEISRSLTAICEKRGVELALEKPHDFPTCPCSPWLSQQLGEAIRAEGFSPLSLPSGAGHDAVAMADITAAGMLFVRCERAVSYHPAESVLPGDVDVGARVLLRVLENFQPRTTLSAP
jgi:allantoate deiminase